MAALRHQLAALVLQLVAPATLGETVVQARSQGIQAAGLGAGTTTVSCCCTWPNPGAAAATLRSRAPLSTQSSRRCQHLTCDTGRRGRASAEGRISGKRFRVQRPRISILNVPATCAVAGVVKNVAEATRGVHSSAAVSIPGGCEQCSQPPGSGTGAAHDSIFSLAACSECTKRLAFSRAGVASADLAPDARCVLSSMGCT